MEIAENIRVYEVDEDEGGCMRLHVHTNVRYAVDEVERITFFLETACKCHRALVEGCERGYLAINQGTIPSSAAGTLRVLHAALALTQRKAVKR